jgi:hypothetical protein
MPMRSGRADELTPEQRRAEVIAILARGLLRYHRRMFHGGLNPREKNPPPHQICLELPAETRLSVSDNTRGFSPREHGDDA